MRDTTTRKGERMRTKEEQQIIDHAYRQVAYCRERIVLKSSARIEWRDFDPAKHVQPICTVYFDAIVNCRQKVFCYTIKDGEMDSSI